MKWNKFTRICMLGAVLLAAGSADAQVVNYSGRASHDIWDYDSAIDPGGDFFLRSFGDGAGTDSRTSTGDLKFDLAGSFDSGLEYELQSATLSIWHIATANPPNPDNPLSALPINARNVSPFLNGTSTPWTEANFIVTQRPDVDFSSVPAQGTSADFAANQIFRIDFALDVNEIDFTAAVVLGELSFALQTDQNPGFPPTSPLYKYYSKEGSAAFFGDDRYAPQLEIVAMQIPEPQTWQLMAAAVGALGLWRKRRSFNRLWGARYGVGLGCLLVSRLAVSAAETDIYDNKDFGLLVMAHGGEPEWNQAVLDAVKPLEDRYRVEVAFGMADAETIQQGVRALEARGANRIGVVRLFISGESWYERTEQILGVRAGAPPRQVHGICEVREKARPGIPFSSKSAFAAAQKHDQVGLHHAHAGHSMAFWKIQSAAAFALSRQGLGEAREMSAVLTERARSLSHKPSMEDVLILAHGPGDDAENERWIARIDSLTQTMRRQIPFRRVEVQTLREDWPDKRKVAEERIQAYVKRAERENGAALVIPFRVHGFGPYAEVLRGCEYVADGKGLLPHPAVTRWIERQAALLQKGEFRRTLQG